MENTNMNNSQPTNSMGYGFALTGFILSLVSLCAKSVVFFMSPMFCILGLIFSIIGFVKLKSGSPNRGFALAGMIISGISLFIDMIIGLIVLLYFIISLIYVETNYEAVAVVPNIVTCLKSLSVFLPIL